MIRLRGQALAFSEDKICIKSHFPWTRLNHMGDGRRKRVFEHMRTAKAQINLRIRAV